MNNFLEIKKKKKKKKDTLIRKKERKQIASKAPFVWLKTFSVKRFQHLQAFVAT